MYVHENISSDYSYPERVPGTCGTSDIWSVMKTLAGEGLQSHKLLTQQLLFSLDFHKMSIDIVYYISIWNFWIFIGVFWIFLDFLDFIFLFLDFLIFWDFSWIFLFFFGIPFKVTNVTT